MLPGINPMTEEGKEVSFTTASGKAVNFKSKGAKPRAKKEVVATPVETEQEPPVLSLIHI